MLSTPVLLLVYNRADLTTQVLAALKEARPRALYIAADGPNPARPGDPAKCAEVRALLRREIDWDCNVTLLLREKNLGCRKGVSSAITWFFEQVEEGIIFEDDTVPGPDFFRFAETMLARYRHDPRVFHITGDNFQFGRKRGLGGAYFSIHPSVWGWATWRRAWAHYDADTPAFLSPSDPSAPWLSRLSGPGERQFWLGFFRETACGKIDSWAFQWVFTLMYNRALCVVPNVNLVTNIGFREDATHTRTASPLERLPREPLPRRLATPSKAEAHAAADRFLFRYIHQGKPLPPLTFRERLGRLAWRLCNGLAW